ncbi:receptor-type tyrosine-protein phosphatase V-like isoform X7 [Leptonychotes weddellii]|uniref:Receptor-type tyrosine-protein phosphatase V n=1 Tax=Leptonychotes weddellii TaxID=9713 RepID=A0A7F8Q661_LEPWE|nr:receptor-type tyrosine-protein phosphatase V-like isoform X7 [Leptonychotes weddellii]
MRPSILFAAFLWLRGFLAKGDECHTLAGSPDRESGGPPLKVNVSSQGRPTSLFLSWAAPGPDKLSHVLRLTHLSPRGSPEGQPLQAHTDASSFEFRDLVPGSRYLLEVTALRACGQNATVTLAARTAPSTVYSLRLHSPGSPSSLEASWGAAPGEQDGYQLLLYHLESQALAHNTSMPPGTLSYNFSNLLPGSEYVLEVTTWAGNLQAKTSIHQWTDPSAPLDLVLIPLPSVLWASWKAGPGACEGYLLRLSGQVEKNTTRGPGALNATFLGPLPAGYYTLELRALAGPYGAWARASAWLDDSAAQPRRSNGTNLQPDGLAATRDPRRQALLYTEGAPGLLRNISMPPATTRAMTRSLTDHTIPAPPANLSLGLASQPPALTASWSPPPGDRDGFQLWLYRLRPLTLESKETLAPEAQNFSWAQLPPGTEFLVQLVTVRGPDESSRANATGWTPPLAPPLVNVTPEGPTQLRASWAHAPGARDGYQVTLYQAGAQAGTSTVGAEVDSTSFSALTPGTQYEVEIVSKAGPLHTAAANASGWTSPLTPSELLVSMQAGSAVINLAWASGPLGHGACHAQLSAAGHLSWERPLGLGQVRLVLRDLTPGRNLSLSVLCRAGPLQASTHPVVLPVEPGPVEDVQCQPEATRLALTWMVPSGDVAICLVVAEQVAAGGSAHLVFQANTSGDALLLPSLVPATSYRLSLTVLGRNGLWSRVVTLVCATSVEGWHPPDLAAAPQLEPEAGMGVMITRGMFGKDDGQIQWYGIITTTNMSLVRPPQEAISHTWYDHYYGGHDSYLAILLPNPFYPGPWAVPRSWMVPMGTEDCGQTQEICNGQLKPGSQYRFSVVAFTRYSPPETIISFSAFSEPRVSVSGAVMPLPAVVGIMGGCVLTVCAMLGLLCWRRVKGQRAEKNRFSQEPTAYNLRRTHRPIPIQSFRQNYEAKSAHAHQAFFQEFEELKEVGKEQPRLEAEHPANATKNRYPHVLPYDHSRVRLTQLEGEPHSDYINANFIPGYTDPQEFIATQGPLKKTLEDFWRLVWEQQVHIIVMLTVGMENGRVLCEHYWPADPTPITHGHIMVRLLAEEPEDEWTKREFQLQHVAQQQQRRVKQLQFTTWPDHSVPEAPGSLLTFAELVREQARATQATGPILVHCSAGVGRTGTFVALSRLLQQLEEEQTVDVFNAVYALRLYRPLMIQTPSQYIFLHSCLLNKILEGPSDIFEAEKTRSGSWGTLSAFSPPRPSPRSQPISVRNFAQACAKRAANANAGFLKEYKLLLQAIKNVADSSAPPPGYEQDSMVSYDYSQVQFSPVEDSPPNEMLEAWLFPGGPSGHDHVVLTGPAGPEELWELVWEHGAHVLVSLCPPDTWEKEFWPTETRPIVTDMVTVHWVAESSTAGWPCTLLRVTHGKSRKEREVQRLLFPCWEPGRELPAATLLPFLAAVGRCCSRDKTKPGTLLSHSSRGVAQLGTFLAMDQLLQQAGAECTVDIFNVALQQSQACGLMTPTLEQYIYLYTCLNSALMDGLP